MTQALVILAKQCVRVAFALMKNQDECVTKKGKVVC